MRDAVVAHRWRLPALAERADRDKPVNIEADRITVDDAKKIQVFEGNVQLVAGHAGHPDRKSWWSPRTPTASRRASPMAAPAAWPRFRQKREGKDEYVDGEAERIEYDSQGGQGRVLRPRPHQERPRRSPRPLHLLRRPRPRTTWSPAHARLRLRQPRRARARRHPAEDQGRQPGHPARTAARRRLRSSRTGTRRTPPDPVAAGGIPHRSRTSSDRQ